MTEPTDLIQKAAELDKENGISDDQKQQIRDELYAWNIQANHLIEMIKRDETNPPDDFDRRKMSFALHMFKKD